MAIKKEPVRKILAIKKGPVEINFKKKIFSKKTMNSNNINPQRPFKGELNKILEKLKTFVTHLVLINFIHSRNMLNEVC